MESQSGIKEKIIVISIFALIIGSIYYIKSKSNYMDPINSCYIYIEDDMLRGNNETIFKAIDKIKKENFATYKTLCSNVDVVSENFCEGGNRRVSTPIKGWNNDGCYIKGSKVIYIKPEKNVTLAVIDNRAEMLKRYSVRSQEFWNKLSGK